MQVKQVKREKKPNERQDSVFIEFIDMHQRYAHDEKSIFSPE